MSNENVKENSIKRDERVLIPLTDIYETSDNYTLKLEMPGVVKDQLDITIENNDIEIRGAVDRYNPGEKELKYSEFAQYDYFRKFSIGNDIDRNKITATFDNGVLTLVLQKSEAVKPKKIAISVH